MYRLLARKLFASILALGLSGGALATPVLIDFGSAGGPAPMNLEQQGFLFSPSCHYDLLGWIGFDAAGCTDPQTTNPDYRGTNLFDPNVAYLYVARLDGGLFTLDSLELHGLDFGQANGPGFDVTSSAGGHRVFGGSSSPDQGFAGDEWGRLSWLVFSTRAGLPVGFDKLRVDTIPEPGTITLAALALAAAAACRRRRRGAARMLGGVLLAVPMLAQATLIDFSEQAVRFGQTDNFVSRGFVFSPGCHYDVLDHLNTLPGVLSGNWLGFDGGGPGCAGGAFNADYLGPSANDPPSQKMYVARDGGGEFSLLSFAFVSIADDLGHYTVNSSKGGSLEVDWRGGEYAVYDFSAPEWRGIAWLEFIGGGGGAPAGFDNLVVDVPATAPEPPMLMLVAASLGLLGLLGRRTRP